MLNPDGGIETDLTVVCLDNNHFRIISSAATRERDKFHIKKYLSKDIELIDITDDLCVFGLFGPKSRDLIKTISKDNFENDEFKFGTAKYITIEGIKIWVQRLSYVGELGYELYVELKDAKKIYELKNNVLNIYSKIPYEVSIEPGKSSNDAGKYAFESLKESMRFIKEKKINGLVTLPFSKINIQSKKFNFPGHTEFLMSKTNQKEHIMMMVTKRPAMN